MLMTSVAMPQMGHRARRELTHLLEQRMQIHLHSHQSMARVSKKIKMNSLLGASKSECLLLKSNPSLYFII